MAALPSVSPTFFLARKNWHDNQGKHCKRYARNAPLSHGFPSHVHDRLAGNVESQFRETRPDDPQAKPLVSLPPRGISIDMRLTAFAPDVTSRLSIPKPTSEMLPASVQAPKITISEACVLLTPLSNR